MPGYNLAKGRCPFCNRFLNDMTDSYVEKHVSRCRLKLNPYKYSDRRRGRPSGKEKQKWLEENGRL